MKPTRKPIKPPNPRHRRGHGASPEHVLLRWWRQNSFRLKATGNRCLCGKAERSSGHERLAYPKNFYDQLRLYLIEPRKDVIEFYLKSIESSSGTEFRRNSSMQLFCEYIRNELAKLEVNAN